jgi:VIT1/CCC1 family predicted Fe2+/Mn2+ transporter
MTRKDIRRWRRNYQDEVDTAAIYRVLAAIERESPLSKVYQRLAETEEQHARFWADKLRAAGKKVKDGRPSLRSLMISWLARRFGTAFVMPSLVAREQIGGDGYDGQVDREEAGMAASEHSHARLLGIIARGPTPGLEGSALARLEGRHRAIGGNALRAAVLGANDGLSSVLSLVMGVAGANLSSHAILITGMAGLLAGACSMAMGEWLSVQSSRELAERQIAIEADELRETPAEEQEELALIYQAKGMPAEDAQAVAARLMADRTHALDTLAREELGIDPKELGGSAWEAAIASFVLFVMGAIIPVAPFVFLSGRVAIGASLGAGALGLVLIGAAISLVTGRGALYTGLRQLLIGLAAAAVTYGIGRLLGVAVAG